MVAPLQFKAFIREGFPFQQHLAGFWGINVSLGVKKRDDGGKATRASFTVSYSNHSPVPNSFLHPPRLTNYIASPFLIQFSFFFLFRLSYFAFSFPIQDSFYGAPNSSPLRIPFPYIVLFFISCIKPFFKKNDFVFIPFFYFFVGWWGGGAGFNLLCWCDPPNPKRTVVQMTSPLSSSLYS
jgi:hypothetical protein